MSKVIVITGAGVGLGRALARRFAKDGDKVVLLGRTLSKVEAAAKEIGANAIAIGCDVTSPDSVKAAFAEIAKTHPKIDVLINNAAVYEPSLIATSTDKQILQAVNTNVLGPILCARAAIAMMGPGSHIINISSESVGIPHFPHMVLYQSSKAALESFSTGLFYELQPAGIRVTNVRAGAMFDDEKEMSIPDPEAWKAFGMAAAKAGLNFMERPVSHVKSVTDAFRAVIDSPPDVELVRVEISGRRPA